MLIFHENYSHNCFEIKNYPVSCTIKKKKLVVLDSFQLFWRWQWLFWLCMYLVWFGFNCCGAGLFISFSVPVKFSSDYMKSREGERCHHIASEEVPSVCVFLS